MEHYMIRPTPSLSATLLREKLWLVLLVLNFIWLNSITSAIGEVLTLEGRKFEVTTTSLDVRKIPPILAADAEKLDLVEGTRLVIAVKTTDAAIASVDQSKSVVTKFVDDKGTDLLEPIPRDERVLADSQRTADGHGVVAMILSPIAPTQGAMKLELQASLDVRIGSESKIDKHTIAFKKGEKLLLAGTEITVGDVSERQENTLLRLEFSQPPLLVQNLRVLGPDAREISSEIVDEGQQRTNSGVTYWRTLRLSQKVSSGTIEATYWSKSEPLTIPINLVIGIGL
jgi:hypothetical protein